MGEGDPNPGGQAEVVSISGNQVLLLVDADILEYLKLGHYTVTFRSPRIHGSESGEGDQQS